MRDMRVYNVFRAFRAFGASDEEAWARAEDAVKILDERAAWERAFFEASVMHDLERLPVTS